MEGVVVERLVDGLMEAEIKNRRRMKNLVAVKIKKEIVSTICAIKIMEMKEEEEEDKY